MKLLYENTKATSGQVEAKIEELYVMAETNHEYIKRVDMYMHQVESNCKATLGNLLHQFDATRAEADVEELKRRDELLKLKEVELDQTARFERLERAVQGILDDESN